MFDWIVTYTVAGETHTETLRATRLETASRTAQQLALAAGGEFVSVALAYPDAIPSELLLRAPDGAVWRLAVTEAGELTVTAAE